MEMSLDGTRALLSDEHIVGRILGGDSDGFRELVGRYQDAVYRLSYRILGRAEDAEDAVQDVFVLVFKNLSSWRESGKFWPWARKITVNVCLKRLRRDVPSEDVAELQDAAWSHDDPVQTEVLRQAERQAVRDAVAGLPAIYRTVVVLRCLEELSYEEIAEALREPVSRIQVRVHRAKKMLAERLTVRSDDAV